MVLIDSKTTINRSEPRAEASTIERRRFHGRHVLRVFPEIQVNAIGTQLIVMLNGLFNRFDVSTHVVA